jgi:hypothetical protein
MSSRGTWTTVRWTGSWTRSPDCWISRSTRRACTYRLSSCPRNSGRPRCSTRPRYSQRWRCRRACSLAGQTSSPPTGVIALSCGPWTIWSSRRAIRACGKRSATSSPRISSTAPLGVRLQSSWHSSRPMTGQRPRLTRSGSSERFMTATWRSKHCWEAHPDRTFAARHAGTPSFVTARGALASRSSLSSRGLVPGPAAAPSSTRPVHRRRQPHDSRFHCGRACTQA